jgi:hypothetical protein
MSSESKKKEPRHIYLSEARASHSHKMWTEVSSSVPHFLQVRLLLSPITYRCLLKVLCPVSRPVTALDCVLLKESNQAPVARLGPEINSQAFQAVTCMRSECVIAWQHLFQTVSFMQSESPVPWQDWFQATMLYLLETHCMPFTFCIFSCTSLLCFICSRIGWVHQKHNCLYILCLICWRWWHVSAAMGHLQVIQVYKEETSITCKNIGLVVCLSLQRHLVDN